MYVAIEGIKGTGKSSIMTQLLQETRNAICCFPITKPIPVVHPLEALCINQPWLKQNDFFLEKLFAERAKWHQQHLLEADFVLGDRSVITSYVTRWNKWGDPYYTLKRSKQFHKNIKHPDVVVWFKSDAETSIERIQKRSAKPFGSNDEQPSKLREAAEIYEELLTGKLYAKKVAKAQIISINATAPLVEVAAELNSIIKFYNN